jgi:hypothetical protein
VKLGIELDIVVSGLRKRPAVRKPDWPIFMEDEINKLQEVHVFESQVLEKTRDYFFGSGFKEVF